MTKKSRCCDQEVTRVKLNDGSHAYQCPACLEINVPVWDTPGSSDHETDGSEATVTFTPQR